MKTKTLITLTAAALLAGIAMASAQNGSTSPQDTSTGTKSHAARVHTHHKPSTTGAAVGDPGTTQRDKDVNYWATHK